MSTFIKAGFWEKLCKPCKGYKGWLNLDELIKSLAPPPPEPTYRVYTALLTQSGGSNIPDALTSGDLVIGVTYTIGYEGPSRTADFTNVGAPNNEPNTMFVATGTTPNSWGVDAFLEYNTGAPVVTVLENTIGNIWFTYDSVGNYFIKSGSLFTNNFATFISGLEGYVGGGGGSPLGGGTGIYKVTSSQLILTVVDGATNPQDGMLIGYPIEIRVYN